MVITTVARAASTTPGKCEKKFIISWKRKLSPRFLDAIIRFMRYIKTSNFTWFTYVFVISIYFRLGEVYVLIVIFLLEYAKS